MSTPHIPCLRLGEEYRSFNESKVKDYRDGSVKATMSQVNAGVIRRDLLNIKKARDALQKLSTRELIDISAKAGELFLNGNLPLGEGGYFTKCSRLFGNTFCNEWFASCHGEKKHV